MSRSIDSIFNHSDSAGDDDGTVVLAHRREETNVTPLDQNRACSTDTSPSKRRSRSRKLIPTVEGDKVIAERFRTKLCRNYLQHPDHPCPYEDRCMFAHGDHELRTAAQNIVDGLMTEGAIRDFKQNEAERTGSTSFSGSSYMSSVAAPFKSRFIDSDERFPSSKPDQAVLEWAPSHDDAADTDRLHLRQSNHHGSVTIVAAREDEPIVGRYTRNPYDVSSCSIVASSLSTTANAVPSLLPYRQYGPQPCLDAPKASVCIDEERENKSNRSSTVGQRYTHDPYSWRECGPRARFLDEAIEKKEMQTRLIITPRVISH